MFNYTIKILKLITQSIQWNYIIFYKTDGVYKGELNLFDH